MRLFKRIVMVSFLLGSFSFGLITLLWAAETSTPVESSSSSEWTAYREIEAEQGDTLVITLDSPGTLLSCDKLLQPTSLIKPDSSSIAEITFRFFAKQTGKGNVVFQLVDEEGHPSGRMEYLVTVVPSKKTPPPKKAEPPAPRVTEVSSPKKKDRLGSSEQAAKAKMVEVPIPPNVLDSLRSREEGSGLTPEMIFQLTASDAEIRQFELASQMFSRRYYDQAAAEYQRLINVFPASPLAPLAQFKTGEARYERAKECLVEADDFKSRRLSGRVGSALDNADSEYAAAAKEFVKVVALYPASGLMDDGELYYAASLHGQAKVAFRRGKTEEAPGVVQEYLRTILSNPAGPLADEAVLGVAEYYRDRGDAMIESGGSGEEVKAVYQKSVDEYLKLVNEYALSSSVDEALFALGRIYDANLEMRDFEKAVKYYDQLSVKHPKSPHASAAQERSRFIKANYL